MISLDESLKMRIQMFWLPAGYLCFPLNNKIFYYMLTRETHSNALYQGCQTHFHGGPYQPCVAFKRLNVILGLYKCNYSLTVKRELGAAAG